MVQYFNNGKASPKASHIGNSVAVSSFGATAYFALITPEMARTILDKSKELFESQFECYQQRKTIGTSVELYSNEMIGGTWMFNGDTICFDCEERCIDGYTRLNSIIRSGISQECLIVDGIENKAMVTKDIGRKRSVENALQIQGYAFEKGAAAIVNAKMNLDMKHKSQGQSNANNHISRTAQVEEFENNMEAYNNASKYAKDIYSRSAKVMKQTEVGAIYMYLTQTCKVDAYRVEAFFTNLVSYATAAPNDKKWLNTITELKAARGTKRYDCYIKCWNAYVKGNKNMSSIEREGWFYIPNEIFEIAIA